MKLPVVLTVDKNRGFTVAATLLSALFAWAVLWIFVVGTTVNSRAVPAVVMALGLLALFMTLTRTGRIGVWRRVFFVTLALGFFPSFIAQLVETRGSMLISEREIFTRETPACFITLPSLILPWIVNGVVTFSARLSGHFASLYSIISIWLIGSLTVGRGWCSWVCFFGGWDDGCSRIVKKPLIRLKDPRGRIRYFGFAVLIFVALASLATFTSVYCSWLCPFKLVTEIPDTGSVYGFLAFVIAVLGFFALVVVLPLLTRKRVQCMSFCPFGAFQSLVDRVSPYRVRIDTARCTGCLRCAAVCPTLSLREEDIKAKTGKTLLTCTKCGECVSACPAGAIRYEFAWVKTTSAGPAAPARRDRARPESRLFRVLRYLRTSLGQVFSAQGLFTLSGFCLGSIVCGGFAIDTLARLVRLATHGTFLF